MTQPPLTDDEISLLKRIVDGKAPMRVRDEGVRLATLVNRGLVYARRVYGPTEEGAKLLRELEAKR